ncbi:hypothetical protein BpHYR1_018623 [Brachionus plicatilis]|uniref:Uncharacterized protein n=1 Tax=Brachionus plicatilis TaxID=10195 RepID=A0A3M7SJS3_BRAPC|nr:hypothetical protein BpHYR1_018623 [Brachionus plicatilis]
MQHKTDHNHLDLLESCPTQFGSLQNILSRGLVFNWKMIFKMTKCAVMHLGLRHLTCTTLWLVKYRERCTKKVARPSTVATRIKILYE